MVAVDGMGLVKEMNAEVDKAVAQYDRRAFLDAAHAEVLG
jgi:hypothetical protein